MKLTKKIIKEMVQQELNEGLTRWKIYVKGESKPFVVSADSSSEAKKLAYMMLKNNKVKVDKVIKELKFGSQAQYDSYKRKHHIKKGTQITVGGKKTTHKGKGKISKASAKKADKWADNMNAKLDALEKEMKKKKKNEGNLSEAQYKTISLKTTQGYKEAEKLQKQGWVVAHVGLFTIDMVKEGVKEGKLTEMNEPWFEITYKDSRGRTKTDSMRAKNPNQAKKDFVNLMKGRGFKVLKVVKEGKLTEGKFYAFWNRKKYTIDGKSLYDAKQKAITQLKVPKSKVGLLAVVNAGEHDKGSFKFEGKLSEGRKVKYKKNDWKKYNQLVKKGKTVMIQTSFGDEFVWEDGSNYGVFGSESDGREIELSHDDIDQVEIF